MDKFFNDHEALLEARLCEKFGEEYGLDIHSFVESNIGRSNYRQRMMHCMRNMTDESLDVLADMLKSKLESEQRRAMTSHGTLVGVEVDIVRRIHKRRSRRSKWKQPDETVHVRTYVEVDHETRRLERVDASMDGACLVDATYAFNDAGQRIGKSRINSLHRPRR